MTVVIYGLRIRGEKEVRYVGQSADVEARLAGHFCTANNMPWATDFANWLTDNRQVIEAVALATAPTRAEARTIERQMVQACLAMGHRLFNQWLVPVEKRCNPRTTPRPPRFAAAMDSVAKARQTGAAA